MVHELGHAYLVRRRGLRAQEIMLYAFGGYCRHDSGTDYDNAVIAWGGVLAQALVILLPSYALARVGIWPGGALGHQLAYAFIQMNVMILAFNLIPFPPLDGAKAWQIFRLANARRERSKDHPQAWQPPPSDLNPEAHARQIAEEALAKARDDVRKRRGR